MEDWGVRLFLMFCGKGMWEVRRTGTSETTDKDAFSVFLSVVSASPA